MKIFVNQEIVSVDSKDGITYEELYKFAKKIAKPDREPNPDLNLSIVDMNILYNIVYSEVEKEMLIKKLKNIIKNISKNKTEFYAKTQGHHSCYSLIFKLLGLKHETIKSSRTIIFTLADLHILWAKKNGVDICYDEEMDYSKLLPLKYIKKKHVMGFELQLGFDFKKKWGDPFEGIFPNHLSVLSVSEETNNIIYCVSMPDDYPCKLKLV